MGGPTSRLCLLFLASPAEAIHFGSLVAANGYIFPISDHVLTLKDDGTLYRFQVGGVVLERDDWDVSTAKLMTTIPAKLISIKVKAVCPRWTLPQRVGEEPQATPPHPHWSRSPRQRLCTLCSSHFFICLRMRSSSPPLLDVMLAHSAAAKNIPSDVTVMQRAACHRCVR